MAASRTHTLSLILLVASASALAAGCGSSSSGGGSGGSSTHPAKTTAAPSKAAPAPGAAAGGGSSTALTADATSAATGDVPDNVNFLTYTSTKPAFSIKYPEGWAQRPAPDGVTFQDKNNLVRVAIAAGPAPTVASVTGDLAAKASTTPGLKVTMPPKLVKLHGVDVVKGGYSTQSAPNPVTDKRVTLLVDRYVFTKGGQVATIDLGTPEGVDNVDAFRLMSESFSWK